MILKSVLFWLIASIFPCVVLAAIDVYEFDTESQRHRYYQLAEELRCPKCQNQNLTDSNSQIAADLRRELHRLLMEGKTDREIKRFMVDRYGDFVLYSPPLQLTTLMLWLLPLVLIVVGILILLLVLRQKAKQKIALGSTTNLDAADKNKLNDLLLSSTSHSDQKESDLRHSTQEPETGTTFRAGAKTSENIDR